MFGSTVTNQRQHVGLQKLSALAGVTYSFLGPSKKSKFIHDETSGESSLACSCFRVLENLELTCAVGQLVNETIQAHQKVCYSGSGSLLFLAGAWSRAALECLRTGISIPHIVSAMSEGVDLCLIACRKNGIPIEDLGVVRSESCTPKSPGLELELPKKPAAGPEQASSHLRTDSEARITCGKQKIKLTHSRHFREAKSDNVHSVPLPHSQDFKRVDVARVAGAVSHGCVDAMNLVIEASRLQSQNGEQDASGLAFDISKVTTCVLPGLSEEHACVLPGCVVLLSVEQASIAQHLKEQELQVVLIKGDLCEGYRHLGFNKPTGVSHVIDKLDLGSLSKEEEWIENVLTTLLKLNVNLILISGVVSEKLIQHCFTHRILVVEKIKASILKAFADSTGAIPVTYATQLSKHCVGTGAQAVIWRDLGSNERKPSMAVNISTNNNTGLVTVVLTSCVHAKLQALEDQFWGCAYRVHHALKDRALLPGAGVIEMVAVHHLQKQAEHHTKHSAKRKDDSDQQTKAGSADNPYRDVVLHLMADGFKDYVSTIMVNSGRYSKLEAWTKINQEVQDLDSGLGINAKLSRLFLEGETDDSVMPSDVRSSETLEVEVCDVLCVKLAAWRKAVDLVLLVLQTDAEVITGMDPKTADAQENLMLL
ncbi:chaperonin-containing T-complex member BBS12 [Polymixia lowei]